MEKVEKEIKDFSGYSDEYSCLLDIETVDGEMYTVDASNMDLYEIDFFNLVLSYYE